MSWITNALYVQATKNCEVQDGTYDIMICDVKYDTYQGKNILVVFFKIKAPTWNKIPYRHTIFEGENFDYGYSRLCDCFGVNLMETLNGNFTPFVNKIGKAEFTHLKKSKVVTGYDPNGRPIEEWKTEKSKYVNIRLIDKASLMPPVQQNAEAVVPPVSAADSMAASSVFDNAGKPVTF